MPLTALAALSQFWGVSVASLARPQWETRTLYRPDLYHIYWCWNLPWLKAFRDERS